MPPPSSFLPSPPLTFPSSLCQAPQFLVPSSLSPPKRTGGLPLARTLKGGSRGEGGLSLAYPSFLFPPLSALLHCTARKGGRGRKADPGWESSPLPPSLATCMQLLSLSALPRGSRYTAQRTRRGSRRRSAPSPPPPPTSLPCFSTSASHRPLGTGPPVSPSYLMETFPPNTSGNHAAVEIAVKIVTRAIRSRSYVVNWKRMLGFNSESDATSSSSLFASSRRLRKVSAK